MAKFALMLMSAMTPLVKKMPTVKISLAHTAAVVLQAMKIKMANVSISMNVSLDMSAT